MERNEKLRNAQWWKCRVLKDTEPGPYRGYAKKGDTGFLAIITDDDDETEMVVYWGGGRRELRINFDSVDEAKKHLTCIEKADNKTDRMVSAWNDAMY